VEEESSPPYPEDVVTNLEEEMTNLEEEMTNLEDTTPIVTP
jgi:hypothetical protein